MADLKRIFNVNKKYNFDTKSYENLMYHWRLYLISSDHYVNSLYDYVIYSNPAYLIINTKEGKSQIKEEKVLVPSPSGVPEEKIKDPMEDFYDATANIYKPYLLNYRQGFICENSDAKLKFGTQTDSITRDFIPGYAILSTVMAPNSDLSSENVYTSDPSNYFIFPINRKSVYIPQQNLSNMNFLYQESNLISQLYFVFGNPLLRYIYSTWIKSDMHSVTIASLDIQTSKGINWTGEPILIPATYHITALTPTGPIATEEIVFDSRIQYDSFIDTGLQKYSITYDYNNHTSICDHILRII